MTVKGRGSYMKQPHVNIVHLLQSDCTVFSTYALREKRERQNSNTNGIHQPKHKFQQPLGANVICLFC